MMRTILTLALLFAASVFAAQKPAPVEDAARQQEIELQRGQFRAGQAWRELKQRQHEAKLAEQEVLNTEEAYKQAQRQAEDLKQRLEAARKAHAEALANEAAARRRYDDAVNAVHQLRQTGQPAR
jgi:septal ring factor EnvC (AmiA/AmiB activator)